MKVRTFLFIILLFISTGSTSQELLSWQELDKQDTKISQLINAGELDKAFKLLKDAEDSEDSFKLFQYANLLNRFRLFEYCPNCGICPDCYDPVLFWKNLDFNRYKVSKSKKHYRSLMMKDHPYAGFMWSRMAIASGTENIPRKEQKIAFNRLKPYVEKGDSLATFMFNYLHSDLIIYDDTPTEFRKSREKKIAKTLELLEKEAREGRILSMYYLGVTHRLQKNYSESFIWFFLASRKGHWLSSQYLGDTQSKFTNKQEHEATITKLLKLAKELKIQIS